MRFYFDVKKKHVFAIIGMIVLVGTVIAQTPQNPGHLSDSIWVPASVSGTAQSLNAFLGWLYNQDILLDGRVDYLESEVANFQGAISCPFGMFEVGQNAPSGGSFCMQSLLVGSVGLPPTLVNWASAVNTCAQNGMHLCTAAEYVAACNQAGYNAFAWGGAPQWTDDLIDPTVALVFSGTSCNALSSGTTTLNNFAAMRCCRNLIGEDF